MAVMATHYKGERISDLLQRIEELKVILENNQDAPNVDPMDIVQGYADLAITKAKLTALQGE
jgi:hypothetical protein